MEGIGKGRWREVEGEMGMESPDHTYSIYIQAALTSMAEVGAASSSSSSSSLPAGRLALYTNTLPSAPALTT